MLKTIPGATRSDVLLVTTQVWPNAALLADALLRAGLRVSALCPKRHPMRALGGLDDVAVYRQSARRALVVRAIEDFTPALVVPCDDMAVAVLHEVHAELVASGQAPQAAELIARSLGDPYFFDATRKKSEFLRLAAHAGAKVPETVVLRDRADLQRRAEDRLWPAVLKADCWWGGRGTRVVRSAAEALAAYDELLRARTWFTALKDSAREGSTLPLYARRLAQEGAITLQAFAPGRPLNHTVVCWKGKVLAGRSYEVIETMPNFGNATVVRPVEAPAAAEAAAACVARLGLSGFAGFDFMYDEATGACALLEVNPRVTTGCYTAPRGQASLAQAFARLVKDLARGVVATAPTYPATRASVRELIALFPQEIERDPASAYLRAADHQVPWHEPDLVRSCLEMTGRTNLYGRASHVVKAMLAAKSAPKSRVM